MHCYCSELLEAIEKLRSEMYSQFKPGAAYAGLLDISRQLDDLIVNYYHRVA